MILGHVNLVTSSAGLAMLNQSPLQNLHAMRATKLSQFSLNISNIENMHTLHQSHFARMIKKVSANLVKMIVGSFMIKVEKKHVKKMK